MPRKKIQPRKLGRSSLLASESERADRIAALRAPFLAWFETVPGAEWEEGSTDGMLLYCRWYVNENYPEWGKVFCTFRLDEPIESLQAVVDARDPGYLPLGAEWKILGLNTDGMPAVTREQVIEAFRNYRNPDPRQCRLAQAAYGRILNELWYRDHSDGRKK